MLIFAEVEIGPSWKRLRQAGIFDVAASMQLFNTRTWSTPVLPLFEVYSGRKWLAKEHE